MSTDFWRLKKQLYLQIFVVLFLVDYSGTVHYRENTYSSSWSGVTFEEGFEVLNANVFYHEREDEFDENYAVELKQEKQRAKNAIVEEQHKLSKIPVDLHGRQMLPRHIRNPVQGMKVVPGSGLEELNPNKRCRTNELAHRADEPRLSQLVALLHENDVNKEQECVLGAESMSSVK